jgi:hypothetical protein
MSAISYLKSVASAACVSCILVAYAVPVQAETQRDFSRPLYGAAKSYAGKGEMRFDWLKPRTAAATRVTRASMTASPGSGTWVCSPAGFGSKSQCRKR